MLLTDAAVSIGAAITLISSIILNLTLTWTRIFDKRWRRITALRHESSSFPEISPWRALFPLLSDSSSKGNRRAEVTQLYNGQLSFLRGHVCSRHRRQQLHPDSHSSRSSFLSPRGKIISLNAGCFNNCEFYFHRCLRSISHRCFLTENCTKCHLLCSDIV